MVVALVSFFVFDITSNVTSSLDQPDAES